MLTPDTLREYIESSGLTFKKNSVSFIFDCPRCNRKDKLFIRMRDGQFICWYCAEIDGFRGKPEYALSELLRIPVSLVRKQLYGEKVDRGHAYLDPILTDFFGEGDSTEEFFGESPTLQWDFNCYPIDHSFALRGRNYLLGRGIPIEIAKEYGLRYSPERRRVVFPVELNGRLLGFQERTVVEEPRTWDEEAGKWREIPKILSSKGIPRDRTLMFAHRLAGRQHAVVAEGPIDAIKAHLCGGNVASMGKAVSRGQIAFLRQQGIKKLYLALDPDAAEETRRLVKEFSEMEVHLMHAPAPYKDIGAMSFEDVRELFLAAPRVDSSRLFVFLKRWN